MERMIASMQARGMETPDPNQAPPPKPKVQLLTPEEQQEYGDELLNVVGKRAREEFSPEFQELADRLKRIEGRVEGVGTVIEKNQTQTVYQALQENIPDWRDINKSEQFKAWLAEPDYYSGRRRMDLLKEAYDRHEAGRVLAFFRGFTEAAGLPQTPSSPDASAPPLANGNGSGKPSLEDFAAPGRARSAPQSSLPPDKPVYSSAWIAQFMADKRTGKYRGREADADAIERDIYAAQHEGRIHP